METNALMAAISIVALAGLYLLNRLASAPRPLLSQEEQEAEDEDRERHRISW